MGSGGGGGAVAAGGGSGSKVKDIAQRVGLAGEHPGQRSPAAATTGRGALQGAGVVPEHQPVIGGAARLGVGGAVLFGVAELPAVAEDQHRQGRDEEQERQHQRGHGGV